MIIEEYGMWDLLTPNDQFMITNELFGNVIRELDPILHGCEKSFIANFVMSFAYRRYYAG